ncbi:MAG: hypothetical protein PHQ10_04590 [Dehalococcoidales bacterium]|jgi:hypothetical protein|nr:hypothetical protein [Dehalococcoidales bacterium]MDD5498685.1 hypothetical protein [Dehalococcoidales bacterium]
MEKQNCLKFSEQARLHQLSWREKQTDLTDKCGMQNRVTYNHILPTEEWLGGVWACIREPLCCYLDSSGIQANTGKHNLKSSWTQCANIFFPFRIDGNARRMLASFLSRQLGIDVKTIDGVELEYAADGKLSPSQLLGEANGMRGSGQTSPDVAIFFTCSDGQCGIYLIENKYTEHHFYGCSATRKTLDKAYIDRGLEPNPNPKRCEDKDSLVSNVAGTCHQAVWGRQYWQILIKTVNEQVLKELNYCPAMRDGYQLLRQQALAQGIADSGLFDFVYSGVAYDGRNNELISCLKRVGINDFREGWPKLFNTEVRFHCFTHQDLVEFIRDSKSTFVKKWVNYINGRYSYSLDR